MFGSAVRIVRGFPEAQRDRAAALYWQAFSGKLGRVLGPDARALSFLTPLMDPSHAISALGEGDELLGFAGYRSADGGLINGGYADLARVYGWVGSSWRALLLEMLERPPAEDVLQMDGILVAAEARGQGIGTRLLDAIREEAAQKGLSRIRLDVIDTNPRARALYEKQGFRAVSTEQLGPLRHVFGFRSATKMELELP